LPKVLVAEDSEINQKLIAHLLRRLGADFLVVDDGLKAVTEVLQTKYDFVFMDVIMPIKNGLDATREIIAALSPAQRPVIIALTANTEESDQAACRAAGMRGFLRKPMQLEDIKRIFDYFMPVA
jgi:CheY-like chemotaxis protein